MKSALFALLALVSVSSAFADSATLTDRNGVQTLVISGRARAGVPSTGALGELPAILIRSTRILKVKRMPDASFYSGEFVSGSTACPAGSCSRELTIEQKSGFAGPGGAPDGIEKISPDSYRVRGEAAKELFDAIVDTGVKVVKSTSKTPSTSVSGKSFLCVSNPIGGIRVTCTVSINENLN